MNYYYIITLFASSRRFNSLAKRLWVPALAKTPNQMLKEKKGKQVFLDDPQPMGSYTTQFPLGKMTDLQSLVAKVSGTF